MSGGEANEDRDSSHEVTAVLNEIEERAGPRTLVIFAIVTSDSQAEVRERCKVYESGWYFNSVFVETVHSYPSRVRTVSRNASNRNRLSVIVSPTIPSISLKIPSQFRRLEIVACTKKRGFLQSNSSRFVKELILEEDSEYCNTSLAHWNARTQFLEHELATGPGVMQELPDHGMLSGEPQAPPFEFSKGDDVDSAAEYVEKQVSSNEERAPSPETSSALPWLAGISGIAAGAGSAGAFLISSVKITMNGLFVAAGPYAAGWNSATASASLAVAGGAMGTGLAVGAAVTAAVYFIPWKKLGSWLMDAFDRFIDFLKSIWNKILSKFDFLKKILTAILNAINATKSGVIGMATSGINALSSIFGGSESSKSGPMKFS